MRSISTILMIVFLGIGPLKGQTYSSEISDKEIYDFLNWLTINKEKPSESSKFKKKQIQHKILDWKEANFVTDDTALLEQYPLAGLDWQYIYQEEGATVFNEVDRKFILQQYKSIKDTLWHEEFSKSRLIENKKQRRADRFYYSIPLFSKNKEYVIVKQYYYCGNMCAYGGYYIYRKVDENNWEFVAAINTWMS